jgi:hypothetical protein
MKISTVLPLKYKYIGGIIMIWSLIVGAFIGWLGSLITNKDHSMGWIKNIIAGLIGSAVGQALLGSWGPRLAGMAIIPSVFGAVVVIAVISFFFGRRY